MFKLILIYEVSFVLFWNILCHTNSGQENWFEDRVNQGNSILRMIHYPKLKNNSSGLRAEAHEDINLITLLIGTEQEGLEVLNKEKKWIPIRSESDQLVINVGDMLERLTNKKLMSTIHRVVNPSDKKLNTSRYSIPFFLHPVGTMKLNVLDSCIDDENPKKYDDIIAHDYMIQRLKDIGVL